MPTAALFREEVSKVNLGGSEGSLWGFQQVSLYFNFGLTSLEKKQHWSFVQPVFKFFSDQQPLAVVKIIIDLFNYCPISLRDV